MFLSLLMYKGNQFIGHIQEIGHGCLLKYVNVNSCKSAVCLLKSPFKSCYPHPPPLAAWAALRAAPPLRFASRLRGLVPRPPRPLANIPIGSLPTKKKGGNCRPLSIVNNSFRCTYQPIASIIESRSDAAVL